MVTDASVVDFARSEMSELRAVEDLQKEVRGCNDREILPSLALVPVLQIGGVLLGAFAGVEMLGFVLGLPDLNAGDRFSIQTCWP